MNRGAFCGIGHLVRLVQSLLLAKTFTESRVLASSPPLLLQFLNSWQGWGKGNLRCQARTPAVVAGHCCPSREPDHFATRGDVFLGRFCNRQDSI